MFETKGWVALGPGEDERLRAGHLWVYANEIADTSGEFADGDLIWVKDSAGHKLGTGFVNRASKIAVRLLTRGATAPMSEAAFRERLGAAAGRRTHLASDARRLVNAEGDLLPGLVIDQYRDVVAIQTQTLGWELRRDLVVEAVVSAFSPAAVVLKNDSLSRKAEGLECYVSVAAGQLKGDPVITEGGLEFEVDVLGGQKTGFYIDQRDNRKLVLPFVGGRRVLDAFCYTGAWSVMCAGGGAREVLGLDASEGAVEVARRNAARNGVSDRTRFEVADIFDELPRLGRAHAKFDVVILDPPSLAKSRRALAGAARGYVHLNKVALGLVAPGGHLVTCSCSHHVSQDAFIELVRT
ncbi:MAG TPA: class I SAM-dependent rRNA methyltransferase, partial [bacterium]|nr:class I SAM-dependent rRNA methyltransferase [bacterium]